MPFQLNNPVIVLGESPNELDMTTSVTSCTFDLQRPAVSGQNTFGVTAQRRSVKGLLDGNLQISFLHDFDEEGLSSFVLGYLMSNTSLPFAIRENDAEVGPNNREYTGNLAITELQIVDGGPEDIAAASVTWPIDGEVTFNPALDEES